MRGLGWVHANDRQLQTLLTRILLKGRAAELLKPDDDLVALDTYMRRMNFLPDADEQIERLASDTRSAMQAYVDGFNDWMTRHGTVFEFKLLGYRRPEPYTLSDCLRLGKVVGFLVLFTFTFAYIFRDKLSRRPALIWGILLLFTMGLAIRAWANVAG